MEIEDARKRSEGIQVMLKTLRDQDGSYQRYGIPIQGIQVVTIGLLMTEEVDMQHTAFRAASRLEIDLGAIGVWFTCAGPHGSPMKFKRSGDFGETSYQIGAMMSLTKAYATRFPELAADSSAEGVLFLNSGTIFVQGVQGRRQGRAEGLQAWRQLGPQAAQVCGEHPGRR